jgi:short-subunit dehydrogenase
VHALSNAELRTERRVDSVIAPANSPTDANQYFCKLNVSSSLEIAEVAAQIRKERGEPTVMTNNAGIGNAKPILEFPENRLQSIFDINIIAHSLLLQEFLLAMVKSDHGHIVSLASMASFSTKGTNVDYAATKAGVLVLHEGLAQELQFVYNAPNVRTTYVMVSVHPDSQHCTNIDITVSFIQVRFEQQWSKG